MSRMTNHRLGAAAVALLAFSLLLPAAPAFAQEPAGETPTVEQLEEQIDALRRELEEMRRERQAAEPAETDDERLAEIERRLEALSAELERVTLGKAVVEPDESFYGLGLSASKVYQVESGLSIGGYGEMLYEGFDSSRDDGTDAGATDQLDFLRAIVYFGYKFNDRWLFNSEIEFEHASTSEAGSASVEFAYLDYLWRPEANFRAGLLLVPMGFVNELHEPPIFLGARRPDIESVIIPTTWRENGFGLFGDAGSFSYRTYVVNGLQGEDFSARGLRGGRQKGSEALADDLAWVGRLDYTGRPGLLVGASAYIGGSGQDLTLDGRDVGLDTTIYEGHLEWRSRGWELRLLGVQASLDDVALLNQALGLTGNRSVGEELEGWYAQLGYDVLARRGSQRALIPYVRWEEFDTQADVPSGFASNPANDVEALTLGLAFKPIDQVIIKADWQDYDNGAGTALDQFNVALGYLF